MATSPIAIVGPGAIGATVAAYLHTAGQRLLLCGHTPRDRLEVRPDDADAIVVPGPVHTDPGEVTGPVGLVIVAVKTTQIDAAAGWLAKLCDADTVVCVMQNGVEQVERVAPHCPTSTVLPGIVWFGAETQPEGWVRLRGVPRLALPVGPAAESVATLLRDAGCTVDLDADFTTAAWRKLLVNAVAGLMVLSGRRAGMFRRDDVAALARAYAGECVAVARAEGARLGDEVVDDVVGLFARGPADMGTSMLADREAHRALEWEVRNAVITDRARRHQLPTPIGDVLVPLLAAASDGPG
ncbi:oxidoreductase [Mycobacterium sp. pUA109]|uniref:oxidoreductase n=1 Tax=Mycobacterium sp. pUA109 TaxID=3238982 RepID=UPI00351AD4AF